MTLTKGITSTVVKKATFSAPICVRCSQACKPLIPSMVQPDGSWDSLQIDNGLVLELQGGYGMYFDSHHAAPTFAMCGDCVDIVRNLEGNEWLSAALGEIEGSDPEEA